MTGDQTVKKDEGKRRWDLLPYDAIDPIVRVLEFGARKYEAHGWTRGMEYSRLFAAAQRHLIAWWGGEDIDPESGESHLAHAACCLTFLLGYKGRGLGTDDRPKDHTI